MDFRFDKILAGNHRFGRFASVCITADVKIYGNELVDLGVGGFCVFSIALNNPLPYCYCATF